MERTPASRPQTDDAGARANPAAGRAAGGAATRLLDLQRRSGNTAVRHLLGERIQRKPRDFENHNTLTVDQAGTILNHPAQRDQVPTAYPINRVREGDLIEHSESAEMIGGHMFKAEYGGVDDINNVVPWNAASEKAYSTFEKAYKALADKRAKEAAAAPGANGVGQGSVDITTKAKFRDRKNIGSQVRGLLSLRDDKDNETEPRRLMTRLMQHAYESVPESIEASVDGTKTKIARSGAQLMSARESINNKSVQAEFSSWIANNKQPTAPSLKAITKLRTWENF
jgi:hypothetical protein